MLQPMMPRGVIARETTVDPEGLTLLPREEAEIARAVEKRRREYTTVRHLAREALAELGVEAGPILKGDKGQPLWPRGVVGALTHCEGFRGAVVGRSMGVRAIGIDAEPHLPLPDKVLDTVSVESERAVLASRLDDGLAWDRILFCAKEATYKAWFPLTERWLGFEDAEITFTRTDWADAGVSGEFRSHILIDGSVTDGGTPLVAFDGRWRVVDDLILASIAVV
ncbi:4'-phosphopantetheinyl transferase superfamily protein [Tsukamurella sp. 8F]|uniref:4'-phosphopantetheinyl transferase family protein n=1 Tax=unclassified Tsukamurella TaxID=2633480 RepID=UPI0023B8C587|nr:MULTISPECIES: 4'-phosphopantetheinyl transferase superfamily protein [unclassified Tsukamurella]MDF0532039.1 4'-phosphopantetheinyl transferase superfamily protein [Tsukamurella sp. 8J]MDF0587530.1 4'-phosphopantetheinyl transferase superfamily protein [Tsukamurella sp. 8F]